MKKLILALVLCLFLIGCAPDDSDTSWNPVIVKKQNDLIHISVLPKNVVEMHIPHEYGIYDLVRFIDPENDNVCYIFADYQGTVGGGVSGITCVKGE